MARDSSLAEKQRRGHFPVRAALRDQGGNALLRRRQPDLARPSAEPAELASRLLGPAGGTDRFEAFERGLERFAGRAFLKAAPPGGAQGEERAPTPVRVTDRLVLGDCLLEQGRRFVDVAPSGG